MDRCKDDVNATSTVGRAVAVAAVAAAAVAAGMIDGA